MPLHPCVPECLECLGLHAPRGDRLLDLLGVDGLAQRLDALLVKGILACLVFGNEVAGEGYRAPVVP